ncbi:Arc family DNA-binding protein [Jinshanibacter sp. LJY008]|uniref:Arc family DNA-binding protein n=1 Tax=Limnobaculum eriocheiris TaxID=2897391 RepID=A0A9X1SPY7_9GAMM|nr:Arc family DNA-binding protein [Limnobaculum eriocheiris]MCD1126562.1 Arc family DNA-binding protein [Limnobaculum eriocheiris]
MTITSLSVRIPAELRAKLKVQAEHNKHSMNAEIIKRLEESFISLTEPAPVKSKKTSPGNVELPAAEVNRIRKVLKKAAKELKKKAD